MSAPAPASIGEQLRAARKAKGWSLPEAAMRTKVKVEQLDWLEKNQFDLLPSMAYARGFIRIYARELGLDGWALLRQFHGEVENGYDTIELQPQDLEAIPSRRQPHTDASSNLGFFIIVGTVAVALVIGGVQAYRSWNASREAAAAAAGPATALVPPSAPEVPTVKPAAAASATPPRPAPEAPPAAPAPAVPVVVPVDGAAPAVPAATPVAVPVDPAAVPAPAATVAAVRTLQLVADPGAPEAERWVRVVGLRGGQETTLFEGFLPPGRAIPESSDLWKADQFIVTFREASAVDIVFDGTNYGRYERGGVQRISLPVQP